MPREAAGPLMFWLSVAGAVFPTWLALAFLFTPGIDSIDSRSFEHNDEVNVALRDPRAAARWLQDHEQDIHDGHEVTLERGQRRPAWKRIVGSFIWILERQQ